MLKNIQCSWIITIMQKRVGQNFEKEMWKSLHQLLQMPDCQGWHNQLLGLGSFPEKARNKVLACERNIRPISNVLWGISKNSQLSVKVRKILHFDVIAVLSLTLAPSTFINSWNEAIYLMNMSVSNVSAWLGELLSQSTLKRNEHMSIKWSLRSCPQSLIPDKLWVCLISPIVVLQMVSKFNMLGRLRNWILGGETCLQ